MGFHIAAIPQRTSSDRPLTHSLQSI